MWRLLVWSTLLRELAGCRLRLVATHPDGLGRLAFLGQFPNAHTLFVFALSCVLGAVIAHELLDSRLTLTTYGYLMGTWLLIVLIVFAIPIAAFSKPLTRLKERTLLIYSAQATQHHRAAERDVLGHTIDAVA